jgi:hypothetical protein
LRGDCGLEPVPSLAGNAKEQIIGRVRPCLQGEGEGRAFRVTDLFKPYHPGRSFGGYIQEKLMKTTALLLLALFGTVSLMPTANAQTHSTKHVTSHSKTKKKTMPKHPKNEVTKLEKERKTDPTVKQITPDPKKSPGKHADNLSKNVNHELNRESKDINHLLSGKKKK